MRHWPLTLLMLLLAVIMLVPFWVMLVTSLLAPQQALGQTPAWFAWPPHWENYSHLFARVAMGRYFMNSLLVATVTTVGQVLLCAMAGYAFAKFHFKHKEWWFAGVMLTLMVPPQVNIVPLFFEMKTLHWIDTFYALIVPALFSGYGVFLFRQWFSTLPPELEEAARMDGCTVWQTFWQLALPLATPAVTALAIFAFINSWNSFMWPLIVTQSDSLRTLPVGIAALKGSYRDTIDWPVLMAACSVSVLPAVVLFLLTQKTFVKGLMSGGSKE
jgi:multiple sugar transport system permease protein